MAAALPTVGRAVFFLSAAIAFDPEKCSWYLLTTDEHRWTQIKMGKIFSSSIALLKRAGLALLSAGSMVCIDRYDVDENGVVT